MGNCDWENFLVVVADFVVNDVGALLADVFVILVAVVIAGIVAILLYQMSFAFYSLYSKDHCCRFKTPEPNAGNEDSMKIGEKILFAVVN